MAGESEHPNRIIDPMPIARVISHGLLFFHPISVPDVPFPGRRLLRLLPRRHPVVVCARITPPATLLPWRPPCLARQREPRFAASLQGSTVSRDLQNLLTLRILATPPERLARKLSLLRRPLNHGRPALWAHGRGLGHHCPARVHRRIPALDPRNQFL